MILCFVFVFLMEDFVMSSSPSFLGELTACKSNTSTLCILHLGVLLLLLLTLSGHLGCCCGGGGLLLLGLLDGFLLGALLLGGFFLGLEGGLALLFELVEVALGDGAADGADLVDLGLVDGLGGVLALVVEPVLWEMESVLGAFTRMSEL